jgi:CRISPR-associated endonuclease Cas2
MLVMLAYDCPESKDQTFIRKEFERIGGLRVQYSIYIFNGEGHECERVIRHMKRMVADIEGDIRLFPMEERVWDAQIIMSEYLETNRRLGQLKEFVVIW